MLYGVENGRNTVQIQYWRAVCSGLSKIVRVDIFTCCVSTRECIPLKMYRYTTKYNNGSRRTITERNKQNVVNSLGYVMTKDNFTVYVLERCVGR